MRRFLPALPALACVVLAVVLAIGPTGNSDLSQGTRSEELVESDFGRWVESPLVEISGQGPSRAALRWWQHIQKGERRDSYELLTAGERERVSFAEYDELIDRALRGFRAMPCPGRSAVRGDRAVFQTQVTFADGCPKFPLRLELERAGGGWSVRGIPYIEGAIEVARQEATGGG